MSRPDPLVAFACFDLRAACESLDPATVQEALYENGDVIVSLAGPGASHLRRLRALLHQCETRGLSAVSEQLGKDALAVAQGHLAYVRMIDRRAAERLEEGHDWLRG